MNITTPSKMKPIKCPQCGHPFVMECPNCFGKRCAQPAGRPPEGYVMIAEKALRALSPELFKELQDYCRYPLTKAQPAEAVDEAKVRETVSAQGMKSETI